MENEHELSNKDFEAYIERIKKIAELSSPLIDDMHSPDDYLDTLSGNFREIGGLAKDNRQMIAETLDPILGSDEPLPEETREQIDELIDELVDADNALNTDVNYAVLLSERLLNDNDEKFDVDKYIHCLDKLMSSYLMQYVYIAAVRSIRGKSEALRGKIVDLYKKMMLYIDRSCFKKLDMQTRELVMINSRYGISNILNGQLPLTYEMREYCYNGLIQSLSYASDPFYLEALPDYDWKHHVFRVYEYLILCTDVENGTGFTVPELERISQKVPEIREIIASDPEYYNENYDIANLNYCIGVLDYLIGKVSRTDFKNKLYNIYLNRDPSNFDRNSISENFFIVQDYSCLCDADSVTEDEKSILTSMYREVIDYCFRAPGNGVDFNFYLSVQYIAKYFIEFPGGITIEEFVLNLFAAIHPPTYIHSHMVAKITRCITQHLLKAKPELFVGVCSCPDAQSVPGYADKIVDYAYHAALCHDFGKIYILSIISTYGRKILDDEFALIKQHPAMGALLLEKHGSTKSYADVARGHHLWYNCERGYPTDFDAKSSPVKTIIDIVACADCMDAATDKVGRSYNNGKTLDEYIGEVREGSGTHYAPYLHELLTQPEVYADISFLLDEGRKNTYRETYILLKNVREKA